MMEKKEFRISMPNKPGQLSRLGETLGQRGVNILTIAAIGAANPVIALVTDNESQTRETLQEMGLIFQELEILTVKMPNRPGELGILSKKLADADINIDSIYLLGKGEVVFTVSNTAKAKQILGL